MSYYGEDQVEAQVRFVRTWISIEVAERVYEVDQKLRAAEARTSGLTEEVEDLKFLLVAVIEGDKRALDTVATLRERWIGQAPFRVTGSYGEPRVEYWRWAPQTAAAWKSRVRIDPVALCTHSDTYCPVHPTDQCPPWETEKGEGENE